MRRRGRLASIGFALLVCASCAGRGGDDPLWRVAIHYDLSPMRVLQKEVSKTFLEWFTSMCAVVGGLYTFSMIFEGITSKVLGGVNKKLS